MVPCPKCKAENVEPTKKWKYGRFVVQLFYCSNCGTRYREYTRNGEHNFTLRLIKGKNWQKV